MEHCCGLDDEPFRRAAARSLSPDFLGKANRYTPSPLAPPPLLLLRLAWGRLPGCESCLVCAPLPLRSWFRRSCGAAAAAAAIASGSRAAAVPYFAAARGGGGFPAGVRSACRRLPLGAGYAPSATVCRGLPLRPAAVWARKRALCMVGLRAAPCSPAAVWAHAALRLCSRPLSCPLPRAAATR